MPAVVGVLEPARGLEDIADGRLRVELAALLDEFGERSAGDVLHAEEARAVGLADIVNLDDVRVGELCRGERLAREAGDEDGIGRPALAHHLEGDEAVERELPREVDRAHPTAAELALDDVSRHFEAHRLGFVGGSVGSSALASGRTSGFGLTGLT